MATGTLVSDLPVRTKQSEVRLTSQKQFALKAVPRNATQCNVPCPICQSEGQTGACKLNSGHTGEHQCNRVSTHLWSSSTDVPGPH